ncbi:endolytic transglycosylase MltG [Streptomyces sp. NBC_00237]|uniref:endolytic transglycosylase MltG n=1 Tax=Streptomyces sp. NBC_00237 TaxID=2975687 RepID=UPI0022539832|nr:endolytic transglycosylase MltG [Streptomyces sp. NBC_00237]MCX5202558.1 endolytic transglycosylase MltG [Streptomyces sp. NBC_00237]
MTEYGRGQGSEPWYPQAPGEQQYGDQGDQGWGGQQAAQGQAPYDQTYAGQQQYPPQQGQPQQPYYDSGQYPQAQQQNGQYAQGHDSGQYPQAQQQNGQYGQGHDNGGQYPQAYDSGQYAQAQQQNGQYQQQGYGQQQADWDTGQGQAIPYGMNAADPYSGQQPGYGGEQQDHYGTADAYPPPQPPSQRRAAPEPETEWDADAPVKEEHPFFTGTDDNRAGSGGRDDEDEYDEPASRRGKGGKSGGKGKKKSRNGVACLVVSAVLLGGLGGIAYFGYDFWKARFGPAEDFSGEGSGQVAVEIKDQAGLNEIGNALKKAGVVKSVDAFTAAAEKNPKGRTLQPGAYVLRSGMSAASAVELMLDPKSRSNLMVKPGQRNAAVYADIDKRLDLAKGTTTKVAKEKANELGLPAWVPKDPEIMDRLEGFLYPGTYPMSKGTKPEDVLKKMVSRATSHYEAQNITGEASKLKLKPFELLIVASLVEAEGKTHDDYRKISEVIYNRLKYNPQTVGKLQFDSTYNYAKGQSNINIGEDAITKDKHPYNTYSHTGMPPGPINNPSDDALSAAVNPTSDGWLYFVATDGKSKTEFAKTHDEFLKLKEKFNESQKGR